MDAPIYRMVLLLDAFRSMSANYEHHANENLQSSGCCRNQICYSILPPSRANFNIPSFTEPLLCMFSMSPPGGCTKKPATVICKGSSMQVGLGVRLWHQHCKRVDFTSRIPSNKVTVTMHCWVVYVFNLILNYNMLIGSTVQDSRIANHHVSPNYS